MNKFLFAVLGIAITSTIILAISLVIVKNDGTGEEGVDVEFIDGVYISDGKVYVPIQELSEVLGVPVVWNDETKQLEYPIASKEVLHNETESNTALSNGVIPDEEAAKSIAKIIFESCLGKPVEYQENGYELYLTVDFSEARNVWIVVQWAKYNGEFFGGGNNISPRIMLDKSTGEVISIDLELSWDRIIAGHQEYLNKG